VRWGVETDTDDAEGKPVATSDIRPEAAAIRALLPDFTGEIMQRPPAFSALKVDGARAYDLARAGEEVLLEERPVSITRLDLVAMPDVDHAIFEAECGKGTYVRALARDIGRRLGCRGHVASLRRLRVGPFDESTLIGLAELTAASETGGVEALDQLLRPIGFALSALPEIAVSRVDEGRVRLGQSVLLRGRDAPQAAGTVRATAAGETIAIGEIAQGQFHPRRVFRT
jgi:tRNA pseudouridine55 synthase